LSEADPDRTDVRAVRRPAAARGGAGLGPGLNAREVGFEVTDRWSSSIAERASRPCAARTAALRSRSNPGRTPWTGLRRRRVRGLELPHRVLRPRRRRGGGSCTNPFRSTAERTRLYKIEWSYGCLKRARISSNCRLAVWGELVQVQITVWLFAGTCTSSRKSPAVFGSLYKFGVQ